MLVFKDGRNINPLRWPKLQQYPELLKQMAALKPLRMVPIHKADGSKEAPELPEPKEDQIKEIKKAPNSNKVTWKVPTGGYTFSKEHERGQITPDTIKSVKVERVEKK